MAFYVARLYSWTDRHQLLKIGSAPFTSHECGEEWAEFLEETEPHNHPWFVIEGPEHWRRDDT
jgi:hypothetical protein